MCLFLKIHKEDDNLAKESVLDWKTEEQFRKNAERFYEISKQKLRMPYSKEIFIETVCATFSVMRSGEKNNIALIEKIAVKAINELYPQMRVYDIKKRIREIFNGQEIGDASYGRWFDFCCKFRCLIEKNYSYRNIYCRDIAEKEREVISNKRHTIIQKDVIHLILTIELL